MMAGEDAAPTATQVTRSFLVTRGKATIPYDGPELALETLVERTILGGMVLSRLNFERRLIVDILTTRMSIAEVSAHLRLPMLSTIVLVSQLVADGLVEAQESQQIVDLGTLESIRTAIVNL